MAVKGASQTDPFGPSLDQYGVLKEVGVSDKYIDLAKAIAGKPREFDPALASFLYFSKMGELASQPGATFFGSVAGAASSPAEYLMKLDEENRKIQATVPATAINLMKALKPSTTGTTTYKSIVITYKDGTTKKDFVPVSEIPGIKALDEVESVAEDTTTSTSTDFKPYGVSEENLAELRTVLNLPNLKVGTDGNVLLTDNQAKLGQEKGLIVPKKTSTTDDASSTIAKLYKDLKNATPGTDEYKALEDQIEAEVKKAGFDKEQFEAEDKISKDFNTRTKDMFESEIAFNKLKAAREEKSGPGDLAMVFSFMKMLDPGSVVRESEFAAAQNTAGLYEKLKVKAEQIEKGTLLSDTQRQNFLDLAEKFLFSGRIHMAKIRLDAGLQVKNYNLNPVNVFGSELAPPSFYLDRNVWSAAKRIGKTPNDLWKTMSPDERSEYQ